MRVLRTGAALLLLLLALSDSSAAQQTTGEIIGKITDDSGAFLPGVTVTIRGAGVPGTPTIASSSAGTYRFAALPPSIYELEFELQGFTTLKRTAVAVAVGSSVEINVVLGVGALTEMITVEGAGPVVNSAAAEVSTTYNREWVENAPTKRFSYFDLVNSSPGVSGNSNVGQSSGAQSMGSSTNENQYQIDGTNISSTPWVSGDAVEEVEVVQLGASAQYGNVQGAVFNIVTRQGSNALHGDVSFYSQSNALTSRNTTAVRTTATPSAMCLSRREGRSSATNCGSSGHFRISATTIHSPASTRPIPRRTTRAASSGSSTTTSTRTIASCTATTTTTTGFRACRPHSRRRRRSA
jgi:hypothetical protein